MTPWRITDERGSVLPQWLGAQAVFERERRPAERRRAGGAIAAG
jgi:hypothetical protein